MKAATAVKKPKTKPKQDDLPEMAGPGIAPVKIPKVDKLARAYVEWRDQRISALEAEVDAKRKLIEALHFHKDQITLPDGTMAYHYDDSIITLEPGKEKLKVKSSHVDDAEED
jgi:hypothetical protein